MTIAGSCHCGKTAFRIEGELPANLTRCTCSFCSKRGALWAYYQPSKFQVTTSAADDATYHWNSKLVAHHFCSVCGCTTFSDSPDFQPDGSWDKSSRRIGVNARLFDDFDAAVASVVVIDGKNLWQSPSADTSTLAPHYPLAVHRRSCEYALQTEEKNG